jgi:predicted DNA binding CopG/RHH family protein
MINIPKDPFKNLKLDEYEQEIEDGLTDESFKSIPNVKQEIERHRAYAKAFNEKTKNINIRISQGDLHSIKSMAEDQGIPYQTLISSLLHQYSNHKIDYNILREPGKPYKTFKGKR